MRPFTTNPTAPVAAAFAAMSMLSACATEGPPDPQLLAAAQTPITCASPAACDAAWSRAVSWLVQNSHWKIQTQTADLIQTYGPVGDGMESAYPGFTVSKVRSDSGGATIQIVVGCLNVFGCVPGPLAAKAAFGRAVRGEVQP